MTAALLIEGKQLEKEVNLTVIHVLRHILPNIF